MKGEAVLLDIGSGNTKGGAEQPGGGLMTFGIPLGTVTFSDMVKKVAGPDGFAGVAAVLRKHVVTPQLLESLEGKQELLRRKRVYLAGGTIWAVVTFTRPADRGDFA